jgi:hypothetical protein
MDSIVSGVSRLKSINRPVSDLEQELVERKARLELLTAKLQAYRE